MTPRRLPLVAAIAALSLAALSGCQFLPSIVGPTETISPYSPAYRAVSLMIPPERAVAGTIQPGQHVDILATVPVGVKVEDENGQFVEGTTLDGYTSSDSTKITLADIQVLARAPETDMYVLKVDLHQAEQLMVIQGAATAINLALRPDGDNRIIDRAGYGETINRVLEQYLFPIERILQIDRYPKPDPEIAPEGSPTLLWPEPDPGAVASPAPSIVPGESPAPSPAPSASTGG